VSFLHSLHHLRMARPFRLLLARSAAKFGMEIEAAQARIFLLSTTRGRALAKASWRTPVTCQETSTFGTLLLPPALGMTWKRDS
jgi:hypothetical protein